MLDKILYPILYPLTWLMMRVGLALLGGFTAEGKQNVPRTGGVLIAPNHISDTDPPTVGLALGRHCWYMAKEELFTMRVLGPLIRILHAFPVKRYTADRAALKKAEGLLESGEAVVIFPEGKLSETGQLQPVLPGVLMIAQHARVPIVPTIIEGTNALMPYGETKLRHAHRRIVVRFGPPVSVADLTGGAKGSEGLKRGANRLRVLMLALQQNRPYPALDTIPDPEPEPAEEKPVTV